MTRQHLTVLLKAASISAVDFVLQYAPPTNPFYDAEIAVLVWTSPIGEGHPDQVIESDGRDECRLYRQCAYILISMHL
jgi:hypothetical protein